tara:strand:+ start:51 stop:677 length:627 start_codon:yes stop_codon:yes gene_type:complete
MTKCYRNQESFNDDPDAEICNYKGGSSWYLKILKKPGWKRRYFRSLKTSFKDEAIKLAKIKYQDEMGTNQVLKNHLFNEEDIKIAGLRKGLGRMCEDKFKNLMMVKGYQVSSPVEDIWGYDFLISKDGIHFYRVQVKSSSKEKTSFHLVTNHSNKVPYKKIVDYMAFISICDDCVWMVPVEDLPDKTGMSLTELKRDFKRFVVDYHGV